MLMTGARDAANVDYRVGYDSASSRRPGDRYDPPPCGQDVIRDMRSE